MENISTLPKYESLSFARWLAKATEEYFKDPEVQRRFAEWQKKEALKKQEENS